MPVHGFGCRSDAVGAGHGSARGKMGQFLGTHQNRLDAKGRVSIPSSFRAGLRAGSDSGECAMIMRPSHAHPCIEAWPINVFNALAEPVDRMDLFSDVQDDLTTALYADAHRLETDKEGRVLLPETLVAHAGLSETVSFMGKGRTFQIWEPAAAARRMTEARERARGVTLPGARTVPEVKQ